MASDKRQLELIRSSVLNPLSEEEAKRLLLRELYAEVSGSYDGTASNGGLLAPLPECVHRYVRGEGEPCPDDMALTYNGIRLMMARYISRFRTGRLVETPSMVFKRVAQGFRRYVNPDRLYRLLVARRFMFNSPTFFNMYVDGAKGSLSACYVTPVYDSMESIMKGAYVQALTFKYGGGQGFNFGNLRPRWSTIRGTGSFSSGPISFMTIYDRVTDSVKQGGKRRGANMGILPVWHPDIYNPDFDPTRAYHALLPPPTQSLLKNIMILIQEVEQEGYTVADELKQAVSAGPGLPPEEAGFIQAKRGPLGDAFLTNFNISVAVNDTFMEAVLEDREWVMVNPQLSGTTTGPDDYRLLYTVSQATGLGRLNPNHPALRGNPYINVFEDILEEAMEKAKKRLEEQGLTPDRKNPYMWMTPARRLFEEIVRGAWETGDPGLLFLDNHNKWSPTPWLGVVNACNPCGEQPLYPFESCNLGSISVEKYVENGRFKLEEFARDIEIIIDAMDAVIDLNKHPVPEQEIANQFTRKIGLGLMGLAEALAKLGIPYDSEEAVAFTLIVTAMLEAFAWKRSWELGARDGPAPAFKCRVYDWYHMKCLEEGDPEELVELHTPALVKAGEVARVVDGYLAVKYHDVTIPRDILDRLEGETRNRVLPDGTVKLVRVDTLERVLHDVFGVTARHLHEAEEMEPGRLVESPRHMLALAVYRPILLWEKLKQYGRSIGAIAPRNTVTTTVAPTGSISILAGTSSGIEPYFALVYTRRVSVGEFLEVVRTFRDRLIQLPIPDEAKQKILEEIARHKGSLRWALPAIRREVELPLIIDNGRPIDPYEKLEELARLFPTAMDFDPWYHLAHQIAAQLYVDQAISKTVNLPKDATVNTVYTVYITAWLGGLKGVTVYRDESKTQQVILYGGQAQANTKPLLLKRGGNGRGRRRLGRMKHLKKKMTVEDALGDPIIAQMVKVKDRGGQVVVEVDENSTCKTCHI